MSKRTALLDGDTFIFAASSATETEVQWDEHNWSLWGNLEEAKARLVNAIDKVIEELEPDEVIVALSDDLRFRPLVMPDYKNNRSKSRKPVTYGPLRSFVHDTYRTYQKPYLEGDDVLGILATHPKVVEGEKIVVAIDKDLRTIPGQLYNYDRQTLETITLKEADRFFFTQALMGDPTDGYKGCPGFGPKTAAKVLDPFFDMETPDLAGAWAAIVECYESKELTEADALMNARVARICRYTDYDYQKNEVILWNPQ